MPRTTPTIEIPDMHGRRAVVTGASDGMGIIIAMRLARAGADVILPVRNPSKGKKALATIRESVPGARVSTRDLDLSSLTSVARLGDTLRSEGEPIHLLINNAGVMTPPDRQVTRDGFELQWGTNHLGHVALVAELLPLLREGTGHVTSQVSIAARRGRINWDDLNWELSYDGMAAYRQSKIALGLFGLELDRRSQQHGWGITSNLSHPGVAPTNLLAARPEVGRSQDTGGRRVISAMSRRGILVGTVESAGLPALYAATSAEAHRGELYGPMGPGNVGGRPGEQRMYPPLRDAQEAARVWDVSQQILDLDLAAV